MNQATKEHAASVKITVAAVVVAAVAAWRMPDILGLPKDSLELAGQAISLVLAVAFFVLLRHGLACLDTRLKGISYGLGLLFAGMTLVGKQLETSGQLEPFTWGLALGWLLSLLAFALVFGSALLLIYQAAIKLAKGKPADQKESRFSRLSGNGFVVFGFLLLCWIPVFLAFWPGFLVHDAVTQFFMYYDAQFTSHHPLLHTLLLGACVMLGVDNTADGSFAVGLAIYGVVQMVLMAGMLAYACHWLRRRGAPVWGRVLITLLFALLPFYSMWSFAAQKDILFGGLALLFVLEMTDLWRDGFAVLKSPWRVARIVLIATLMMLMRNNGLYAFLVMVPFAVLLAKGSRLGLLAVLAGCALAYTLVNGALISATDAEVPGKIEFLSIPLQQIGRTMKDYPEAMDEDTDHLLEEIYEVNPGDIYHPQVADPVKWAAIDDVLDENLPGLLSLWGKLGVKYTTPYVEAFLEQNLPYYLPGAKMLYNIDPRIVPIDIFEIEVHSFIPWLRDLYESYDKTLTLWGLPGIRLLSDIAFYVWLCIAGMGFAWYRKDRQWMAGSIFLLGIWFTCLAGPVAIIRYMLAFFYAVPVMLVGMLGPKYTS